MITRYHAKYYALLLSQKSIGNNVQDLSQSLLNSAVDINPHQIDAALFAFKSPLSKGVVLADEVGLGKTIEAGLVLCQMWSTGKRKIIIVCPASLRKQWGFELAEKFGISSEILDAKTYNAYQRDGKNPFSYKHVVICSYNFAAKKKSEILIHGFDLAIVDEAHKLRNVYRKSARTAADVRDALAGTKKLLLTATPFQNSLMELYGLTTVIDPNFFGSEKTFRRDYGNGENLQELRERIKPLFIRTLRNDVKEYIKYTNRLPLTQKFNSTDEEYELYEDVSEFLRREDIYSVPAGQRKLTTMIIRKILASSIFALISTLTNICQRLERMLQKEQMERFKADELFEDEEADLISDLEDDDDVNIEEPTLFGEDEVINIPKLKAEIALLHSFIEKAMQIRKESKAEALLAALKESFKIQSESGAKRKALIFTESTKTQSFLRDHLEANGYQNKIVLFNGKASEPQTNEIFRNWCDNHPDKISGIKAADRRAAIVDYFQHSAEIMIATEAAAEGLNLQFCSLVINYDLPWNPQRIEQRIGRCHRYGQKYDVVVVNFINTRNYADVRVFDLLSQKFKLFDDVFGASDDVLGQADNVDFESRILQIYQQCRTKEEIDAAFEQLQLDMQEEIDSRLDKVREQVIEHFDINVQEHLRTTKDSTGAFLNRYQHIFWELTKFMLSSEAVFNDEKHTFRLNIPVAGCKKGTYCMLNASDTEGTPYRLSHPLAQHVLNTALSLNTEDGAEILFSEDALQMNAALPDYLQGQKGYLIMAQLKASSVDEEQYTLFTAITDGGRTLTQDDCEKLFLNGGKEYESEGIPKTILDSLLQNSEQRCAAKLKAIDDRNLGFFQQEETRIFNWERDMLNGLEQELSTVKKAILQAERDAMHADSVQAKLEAQQHVEELNRKKRRLRNELDDKEDDVSQMRRSMIEELQKRIISQADTAKVFVIRFTTKHVKR